MILIGVEDCLMVRKRRILLCWEMSQATVILRFLTTGRAGEVTEHTAFGRMVRHGIDFIEMLTKQPFFQ
jgi:uncharacterized protein YegJ (DUF2314 family)